MGPNAKLAYNSTMPPVHNPQPRAQSMGEEIANAVSHGLGLLLALIALPILIINATQHGDASDIVGASIFGATVVILYTTSTVYHALPYNKVKRQMQFYDHAAIYLLIAGSYTPFTLGVLRGPMGWTLFGVIWGLAIIGIALKVIHGPRYYILSTCLYLIMGWLALVVIKPLWENMPGTGIAWLVENTPTSSGTCSC
jgi:hemolysin III